MGAKAQVTAVAVAFVVIEYAQSLEVNVWARALDANIQVIVVVAAFVVMDSVQCLEGNV